MADKKTSLSPAKNIFKDQRVLLAIRYCIDCRNYFVYQP